jgi:hypothetical protein
MPTLTVRRFEYEALKARLKPDDRIAILSCDSCAKQSDGLGGEQGMVSLADKLSADGFHVVHRELLPIACSLEQLTARLDDEGIRKLFEEVDVIVPLSCQRGIERAKDVLPGLRILRVTETLGKGSFSPEAGARLTEPLEGIEIEIDDADGISLREAADRLDLHPGSF